MKNIVPKIIKIYHSHNIDFFVSLVGPFVMGTIHLVSLCKQYDWILLNYCLFYYMVVLIKVWLFAVEKFGIKPTEYVFGAISVTALLLPMMASMVLTILYKDSPHYLFDWFVYLYASYGTLKMVFAIRNLVIAKRGTTPRGYVLSITGLIAALYTIQMMEFELIMFVLNSANSAMFLLQLFTQGAIFLFSLFVIALFIGKHIKAKRARKIFKTF